MKLKSLLTLPLLTISLLSSCNSSEKEVDYIKITNPADRVVFKYNSTFSFEGIEVTAVYCDQTSAVLSYSELNFSTPNMREVGEQVVNISYTYLSKTVTTQYNITINAIVPGEDYIVFMEIMNLPNKIDYLEGEVFNGEGCLLSITRVISGNFISAPQSYENYDPHLLGIQTIYACYENKKCPFTITVSASSDYLIGVEIKHLPNKINYSQGEDFDPTGCLLTAHYSLSGDKEVIPTSYSKVNTNIVGSIIVSAYYQDFSVTFSISVNERLWTIKEINDLIKDTDFELNRSYIGIQSDIKVNFNGFLYDAFSLVKTTSKFDLDLSSPYKLLLGDSTGYIACAASQTIFNKYKDYTQKSTSSYQVSGYISLYLNNPEVVIETMTWNQNLQISFFPSNHILETLSISEFSDIASKEIIYNCAGHGYGKMYQINNLKCYSTNDNNAYLTDGKYTIKVVQNSLKMVIGGTYNIVGQISLMNYMPVLRVYEKSNSSSSIIDVKEQDMTNITVKNLKKISHSQDDTFDRFEDFTMATRYIYKTEVYLNCCYEGNKCYVIFQDEYSNSFINGKNIASKTAAFIDGNNFWNTTYEEIDAYNPFGHWILDDIEEKVTLYFSLQQLDHTKGETMWQVVLLPTCFPISV